MKKIPDHKNGLVSSKFKKPLVGFAGLTHLGINSTVASAAHDFQVVSYQDDAELIKQLKKGEPHVVEPGLNELMSKNKKKIIQV